MILFDIIMIVYLHCCRGKSGVPKCPKLFEEAGSFLKLIDDTLIITHDDDDDIL